MATEEKPTAQPQAQPVQQQPTDVVQQTPSARPKKKTAAIIVVIVAVVLVAGGFLAWYLIDQHNKAVWEQEHKAYPVSITINAKGYDPATSSPIPTQIEGTDFEGTSVSTEALIGSDGTDPISLMRGTYTLTVTASPFLNDGTMYDVSKGSVDFEVVGDSESAPGQGKAVIDMTQLKAKSMTKKLINASSEKLAALGYDQDKLKAFTKAANAKLKEYQEAVAAQKAAEEAARKAAERHISTSWYEFDIPEEWVGKVDYRTEDGATVVYPKGYPTCALISVSSVSPSIPEVEGDIGNACLSRKENGKGAAELWRTNWIYIAAMSETYGDDPSDFPNVSGSEKKDLYDTLVSLISGGKVSYSDIAANPDKYSRDSLSYTFVESEIVPTLKVKNTTPAS